MSSSSGSTRSRIRRRQLIGVQGVELGERARDVPSQEKQLCRADPAALHRGGVGVSAELDRLRRELGGRPVAGPRVRCGGCRVKCLSDGLVLAGASGQGGEVRMTSGSAAKSPATRP